MADDLGFGDIGCCNYGATRTPAIDSLAADGALLTQHYSASPICAPARAAFLTGRYPQRSGVIDTFAHRATDRISRCERTIGDLLGEAGYTTGLVGKWHSGALGHDYHPNRAASTSSSASAGPGRTTGSGASSATGCRSPPTGATSPTCSAPRPPSSSARTAGSPSSSSSPTPPPTERPGAHRRDPHGRHAGAPDGAGDDRRHGRADGRRHRLAARRAPALASARRHPGAVHQRQRSVDAGGVGLRDDGPLQHRAGRGQGAGARGRHPRADDRPLADRAASTAPSTPSPTSPTGCRRCSPSPATARRTPPRRRRRPAAVLRGRPLERTPPRFWQWSRYGPTPFANAAVRDGDWKLRYPAGPELFAILPSDPVEERRLAADPEHYRRR